jgi:hypothetical protein
MITVPPASRVFCSATRRCVDPFGVLAPSLRQNQPPFGNCPLAAACCVGTLRTCVRICPDDTLPRSVSADRAITGKLFNASPSGCSVNRNRFWFWSGAVPSECNAFGFLSLPDREVSYAFPSIQRSHGKHAPVPGATWSSHCGGKNFLALRGKFARVLPKTARQPLSRVRVNRLECEQTCN